MQTSQRNSSHVLIVDDDAILASLYRIKLQAAGFVVDVAESGEAGLLSIARSRPDVVVLDLMLGDMNGVDVLRMLRGNATTRDLPVLVFSSAFLGGLIEEAEHAGATKCLNKGNTPPNRLIDELSIILGAATRHGSLAPQGAAPPASSGGVARPFSLIDRPAPVPAGGGPVAPAPKPAPVLLAGDEVQGNLRRELLNQIDARVEEAERVLEKWLVNPANVTAPYLPALYRAIRALAGSARLTGRVAQATLAGGIEALLQDIRRSPEKISSSIARTVSGAVKLLPRLTSTLEVSEHDGVTPPMIVMVDDDEEARKVLGSALRKAQLAAVCLGSVDAASQIAEWNRIDLAILDLEMPGVDGFELAARIRATPHNGDTPLIFVSGLPDIEQRTRAAAFPSSDCIPKPFLAIELAVKVLATLYADSGEAAENRAES